jgi:outer membrane biosynthesis protein TonB
MKTRGNSIKIIGYVFTSTLFHIFLMWSLGIGSRVSTVPQEKILVKIVPTKVSIPIPPAPPKPIPLKSPLPHKAPKKPKHRIATERPTKVAKANKPPVQGLSKSSFAKVGTSNFQAPVGNTLMTGDMGIRKESVGALQGDLSQRARRLTLVKPEYTEEALQAGLEGQFVADVYVDETGHVGEVSLQKKVGYGMDAHLQAAAKSATYEPRKDALGRPIAGWDRIVFQLVLP